jgi:AcrR family transcriptional regulator
MAYAKKHGIESMRDARRSFTRARICAAAREVFSNHGFATTTLEQIAQAAGTRRSTVYNHFRDKDEILGAIAEDYGAGLVELIEKLPGPVPSRAEIDAWIQQVAAFTVKERTPTVLLMHLGNLIDVPVSIEAMGGRLFRALAARFPAFRYALESGPEQGLIAARALVVLQQLGWACLHQVRHEDTGLAKDMLTVAAEHFERFVREGVSDAGTAPKPAKKPRMKSSCAAQTSQLVSKA